jgi:hypothetical protein
MTDLYTGNIVLYQSYGTSLRETMLTKLVQTCTNGPFVHAGIVLNEQGLTIEAGGQGIAYAKLPADRTKYTMCAIARMNVNAKGQVEPLDSERLARAVEWAVSLLKSSYGFLDLIDQGIDLIVPGNTLRLAQSNHYDCSNFCTAFLDKAGIWLPSGFAYPFNVSPNDLAEWFGLLPLRRRIKS